MTRFEFTNKLKAAAPHILTAMSVAGVIWVAIQSAVDTPKATKRIEKKREESDHDFKWYEKALAAAPSYIPTAVAVTLTSASMIASDKISSNQKAQYALLAAGAYKAVETIKKNWEDLDYQETHEKIGPVSDGEDLFWEEHYGYFAATKEQYYNAILILNEHLQEHGGATLEEFFVAVGLDPHDDRVKACHSVGWECQYLYDSTERSFISATIGEGSPLEPDRTGMRCYEIAWEVDPIIDPWNYDSFAKVRLA